jgi:hypothetical protein
MFGFLYVSSSHRFRGDQQVYRSAKARDRKTSGRLTLGALHSEPDLCARNEGSYHLLTDTLNDLSCMESVHVPSRF